MISILQVPPAFQLIGTGTDAVVVQHRADSSTVYKINTAESRNVNKNFLSINN
jgi:hypothetical protein